VQLAELAGHPAKRADQCAVTCLRATVYMTLNLPERATEVCLEQLRSFGFDWQPHPSNATVQAEYQLLQTRLPNGSPGALAELPLMADADWRACMDVLNAMQLAAVHHDMDLHDLSVLHIANLSIEHGNCEASTLGFAELSMVLSRLGDC
jgi:hypothetical protein